MKLKLIISKTLEIDLSKPEHETVIETLIEKYNDPLEDGEQISDLDDADNASLADVVLECFGDDVNFIDLDIDETNIVVEVER